MIDNAGTTGTRLFTMDNADTVFMLIVIGHIDSQQRPADQCGILHKMIVQTKCMSNVIQLIKCLNMIQHLPASYAADLSAYFIPFEPS